MFREITIADNVRRSQLKIWSFMWHLSKLQPKKFGTRKPETEAEGEEVCKVVVDF